MPYAAPTLTEALAALSARLQDPSAVRWTDAEKTRYLREALRTWNAYTSSYRESGTFNLTTQEPFYDLPTVLPALRGYTVTNRDLITDLQYTLLEPPTPTAWSGSQQFTLADLWTAIERRRDQFLQETGAVVSRTVQTISPSPVGRIVVPQDVLTVRRMAWHSSSHFVTPLLRTDEWALTHFSPAWVQTPTRPPSAYSVSATPPLQVQVAPPPLDTGALDLIAVRSGASMDPASNTVLGIPDDWAWVVKFGALADLLGRDGLAVDPARAALAEARWQQGITAATAAGVVLAGRINNQTARIGSVQEADTYSPTWQAVPGIPRRLLTCGQNLIASWPPPGVPSQGGSWSVTLDVVRNMPVPTVGHQALQIGPDAYDIILDYAQSLALWKEGGVQAQQAQSMLGERFFRFCGVTIALQQASQPSRIPLLDQTTQDSRAVARELPVGG